MKFILFTFPNKQSCLSPIWRVKAPFNWLQYSFDMSLSFFENFLTFRLSKIPASSCAFPVPVMKSAVSPKRLFLALVWCVEIKIWAVGVVVATGVSLLLDFVSKQSCRVGKMYTHTHTHGCFYFFDYLEYREFILISPSQPNIAAFLLAFSLPYL